MEVLKNQTLYKCSYCGKRLLSKQGAKLHESEYCKSENTPPYKAYIAKQEKCEHINWEDKHSYIPGEAVQQIECSVCLDCGKEF